MIVTVPAVSLALPSLAQLGLPGAGSDVGFLVTGIVSLVGTVAVLVLLFYVVRRAWRPIAAAVRYDRHEDD